MALVHLRYPIAQCVQLYTHTPRIHHQQQEPNSIPYHDTCMIHMITATSAAHYLEPLAYLLQSYCKPSDGHMLATCVHVKTRPV